MTTTQHLPNYDTMTCSCGFEPKAGSKPTIRHRTLNAHIGRERMKAVRA